MVTRKSADLASSPSKPPRARAAGVKKPKAGSMQRNGLSFSQPARATHAITSSARSGCRVLDVPISHPDKVLWPASDLADAVTKRDLAEYYAAIGGWLLEHVRGRPCAILRAPNGIDGETFLQRHAARGTSRLLEEIVVPGDRSPYLAINHDNALVAVAQSAGIELHPGNGMPQRPDVPGRLVFDLDPATDVSFDTVIAAALELKERLEALGLETFCKTTGGKGLHVVTPLASSAHAAIDWPTAKTFAQTVCAQMAADHPDRYLIQMSKEQRVGKIFLDYLRNDRLATAVAPLSPRGRKGAPVSMPLPWAEVRVGLDPARFTLQTAPTVLRQSSAWEGYGESERSLAAAARRLMRSQ